MRDIVTSIRNMILIRRFAYKRFIHNNPLLSRGVVILILFSSVENADIIAAGFCMNSPCQYESHTRIKGVQVNSLDSVVLSDTVKQKDIAVNKNLDDELSRAIDEQNKMKNEHYEDNDSDKDWHEDFSSIFDDIEFPDSAAWNRTHENIKEAMSNFRSDSSGFKEEFNNAKVEMNKAIKRMKKQYQKFDNEELNDLKKEVKKLIDDLKAPEKPQQIKSDTIKISPL